MNRKHDVSLTEAWQQLPASRRITYFFALLLLVTMVLGSFQENVATLKRVMTSHTKPAPTSSQAVDRASVNL